MNTTNQLLIIITAVIVWGAIISITRSINRRNDIKQYFSNANSKISIDETTELIDAFIQDAFTEYIIMNLAVKDIKYINTDMEKTIINELTNDISKRMSPVLYDKLSLCYNKSELPYIISVKAYMAVTSYVIEFNQPKNKQPDVTTVTY